MKKKCSIFLLLLFIVFFIGCSNNNKIGTSMVASPQNNKLDIIGQWTCNDYKILDENIATDEAIFYIFSLELLNISFVKSNFSFTR